MPEHVTLWSKYQSIPSLARVVAVAVFALGSVAGFSGSAAARPDGCTADNPKGQRAGTAVPSIIEGADPSLPPPQLKPDDVVFGHGDLWVSRRVVMAPGPVDAGDAISVKFAWFRVSPGSLEVQAKRRHGNGTFRADIPEAGAYPATGFLPTGLLFSRPGCWRVTATLNDDTVKFAMRVTRP